MVAPDSALPTPPFSVVQSLRRAFWRWPSWGELLYFGFNLCAVSPQFFDAAWEKSAYTLAIFIGFRGLDFAFDLWRTRFSESHQRWAASLPLFVGGALMIWLAFQFDWNWIASYRLDWRGATGVFLLGMMTVLFVGPPLELWNRTVKPLDARADLTTWQRFGVAVAAVAACCFWWALLVFLLFWVGSQPNFAS